MTFDAYETAQETGRPIELYAFTIGATTYRYTSAEDTVTVSLVDYEPEAISRGRVGHGAEDKASGLEIELPGNNDFASQYVSVIPGSRARVTVSRVQRPDFPSPEVVTLFDGYVQKVQFVDNGVKAKVIAGSITSILDDQIPRRTFQAQCNHVLYDDGCQVDDTSSSYRHTGRVLTVSGSTITVFNADNFSDGWFTAGSVERTGGGDSRLVLSHTGTTLELLMPFPDDITGEDVVVLAGCAHIDSVCSVKFLNIANMDAFLWVPKKNIFATGID